MSNKRDLKNHSLSPDTSEFDQEFVIDSFHPLTIAEKKRWKKVQAKNTSSKNGKNSGTVTIQVEKNLLAQVDTLANKLGTSRESLITRGIKAVLAANDET